MTRRLPLLIVATLVLGAALYYALAGRQDDIVLTGIVTTDDVIVSSEVQGRLQELLAREGDAVKQGQISAASGRRSGRPTSTSLPTANGNPPLRSRRQRPTCASRRRRRATRPARPRRISPPRTRRSRRRWPMRRTRG